MEAPGLLEDLGRGLHQPTYRTPPAIEDQNLDWAELAVNLLICGCDLRLGGRITLDRKRDPARRFDLRAGLADDLAASGDQRDHITGRETSGESCSKTGPDSYDHRYFFFTAGVHRDAPFLVST
jgi:hypothetical protein